MHPSLKIFYSGDKSGIVCKVDVEDCPDVADGVCIVLARESSEEGGEGINKIVTADDGLLWTASGNSRISRWNIPSRLAKRDMGDGHDLFSDPTNGISNGVERARSPPSSMRQGNFTGCSCVTTYAPFKAAGMKNLPRTRMRHSLLLSGLPIQITRFHQHYSRPEGAMLKLQPCTLLLPLCRLQVGGHRSMLFFRIPPRSCNQTPKTISTSRLRISIKTLSMKLAQPTQLRNSASLPRRPPHSIPARTW